MSRLPRVRPVSRRSRQAHRESEALLDAIGGRTSTGLDDADPLTRELTAFVASVDAVVEGIDPALAVSSVPSTPVLPADILPIDLAQRARPLQRRLLVSAAMSIVILVIAGVLVVHSRRGTDSGALRLSSARATAESASLLAHADTLLDASNLSAPPAARSSTLAAARSDLQRTAALLPSIGDPRRREDLGHRLDELRVRAGLPTGEPGESGEEPQSGRGGSPAGPASVSPVTRPSGSRGPDPAGQGGDNQGGRPGQEAASPRPIPTRPAGEPGQGPGGNGGPGPAPSARASSPRTSAAPVAPVQGGPGPGEGGGQGGGGQGGGNQGGGNQGGGGQGGGNQGGGDDNP